MFDRDLFVEALVTEGSRTTLTDEEPTDAITRACYVAILRKQAARNGRNPAYWLNANISTLHTECLKARRTMQRTLKAYLNSEAVRPYRRPPRAPKLRSAKDTKIFSKLTGCSNR